MLFLLRLRLYCDKINFTQWVEMIDKTRIACYNILNEKQRNANK